MYDDVFFDVTRSYIQRHEMTMRPEMGDAWFDHLSSLLNRTESATQAWHDSEPRIWSRLLGRRRQAQLLESHVNLAVEWFESAIAQWRSEGLLSLGEAQFLRQKVNSTQFLSVMPHFAVHVSSSILLRFPLGSIARVIYTAFHLGRATWRRAQRVITGEQWRQEVGVHSPLVVAIAAIPGFGAFSYLASGPIRSEHLLLRVGLDAVMRKLPWNLYQRVGLRWLLLNAPEAMQRASQAIRIKRNAVRRFGWPDEHRSGTDPDTHPHTIEIASGLSFRSIF
jgi:hypothetical protein